jgi:flagellar biosynthetic protein FliR
MDFMHFDPALLMSFILTLFRISIVLFMLPFFGGESAPLPVKASICLVLTLAVFPHVNFPGKLFPAHPFGLAVLFLGELLLGLILNLIMSVIFAAIQTGGQLVGFQMGYSMVNAIDPVTGTQEPATSHFLYMIAMMTFMALNGHLLLLKAVMDSFTIIPPGGLVLTSKMTSDVLTFSGEMFSLAIRLSAPVVVSIFLVDLALALVSRAAPQMNILMLGFPVKILVGFLFLGMLFTIMAMYMQDFLIDLGPLYDNIMHSGAPLPGASR